MSFPDEQREVASGPADADARIRSVCPNCGAALEEIRGKLHCPRCHLICETCCEGGRG